MFRYLCSIWIEASYHHLGPGGSSLGHVIDFTPKLRHAMSRCEHLHETIEDALRCGDADRRICSLHRELCTGCPPSLNLEGGGRMMSGKHRV